MSEKIHVAVKPVGKKGYFTEIENTLEEFQKLVGGDIEVVTLTDNVAFVCNENGIFNNLHFNVSYCDYDFFGTVAIVGVRDDEFADLPFDDEFIKKLFFRMLEEE